MDQTSVRLQNTYKNTLSPKGAKKVRAVQPPGDPECLTVCADGSKFPASIVFKGNKKTGTLSPRILNDRRAVAKNPKQVGDARERAHFQYSFGVVEFGL
ncbi:hypothetical protein RvY_16247 [Ramazzottius varieornatus]|uniref:Uncharacterized protein n=1 Tax=Ramazzottius varieornatus TaxID=947166 RepID=A0A1D1VZ45_RAMVA|nr:hypothetical protein RvY_16247 [Ramazzottius varieornatus]